MTRTPLQQRIVRNRKNVMTSAVKAFYAIYVMIRWWMMYDFAMNRLEKATILREKYLMSYHNGRDSIHDMVYKSDKTSGVNIRMNRNAFTRLCDMREQRGGLKNSKNMLVDEQVAMFLHVLAHNEKNMIIVERFKRSGETVSRYFKLVLDAVCRLHKQFYKKPVPIPDDETDERWRWFKGCLGALDGTYIKVKVLAANRKPYRTRKGEICTNVLGVCSRDLQFIYVLAGWEGSATDSRVLRDAISRPHGLKIPHGTYYLCDVGYTNVEGFLTPYRGQRYHLNDWFRPPTNAKELYNMRHSSARNVIERCFGLIKSRWAILRDNAYHPIESMPCIIIACCLMHNFIRTTMTEDPLDQEILANHTQFGDKHDNIIPTVETSQGWTDCRDLLANTMFTDWSATRANN
ncbi:protein ALP1-like isoform X2 [Lactuca sativa]|nr:protein ALP1-like isoform X2 [Lactuca sativa]